MTEKVQNFIDGKPCSSDTVEVGRGLRSCRGQGRASGSDVDGPRRRCRCLCGEKAFPAWSATPSVRRARVMFAFKALLDKHLDELAALLTAEHGKVLDDARGSITRGLEVVEFACGIPQLLKGEYSEQVARGVDSWSLRQPLAFVLESAPSTFPP